MHRDQSPLRARPVPGHVPPLLLDVDQMLDEFTRRPVRAAFHFDPDAPAVISVEFLAERGPGLLWRIGRELLHRGVTSMSGSGEVRMWPTLSRERPSSWLLLESPDVEALFELPTARLAEWLDATYRIVTAEAEMAGLDWDAFLRRLLGSPGATAD
ncbi:SsgA family sporulation/cell division regulator [Streptomyces longispororuber]|uniref:SsgA family sporulation/cell division regulator n=1 Tax=Streptomyces longispororuber TaxID=68230 RepID=UPI00210D5832|nr:SsgA family sporulation/cell division regulator [Streptomyces longispororuber]MCQ4205932.1 SsgA family sporulation/cell division regulator [Streptomyces longispororuber]